MRRNSCRKIADVKYLIIFLSQDGVISNSWRKQKMTMPKQIPVWGGYVNQVWPVHLTHLSTGTYTFVILECYRFWNLMLLIFPPNLSLCVTSLSAIFSAEPKEKIYIFSHLSYNILDSLFTQGHILKPITEEISWDTQLNLEELLYRTDRTTKTLSISGEMPVKHRCTSTF